VTGGPDMTLQEAETACSLIQQKINPGARIIWGSGIEPEMEGKLQVMVVVTGVESPDVTGASMVKAGKPVPGVGPKKGPGDLDAVG